MTPEKIDTARKLLAADDKPVAVAKLLQVGLSTFYRHCLGGQRSPKLRFSRAHRLLRVGRSLR